MSVDRTLQRHTGREREHSLATGMRYLILHALRYDHETDQGEMNSLELEMQSLVGLA